MSEFWCIHCHLFHSEKLGICFNLSNHLIALPQRLQMEGLMYQRDSMEIRCYHNQWDSWPESTEIEPGL